MVVNVSFKGFTFKDESAVRAAMWDMYNAQSTSKILESDVTFVRTRNGWATEVESTPLNVVTRFGRFTCVSFEDDYFLDSFDRYLRSFTPGKLEITTCDVFSHQEDVMFADVDRELRDAYEACFENVLSLLSDRPSIRYDIDTTPLTTSDVCIMVRHPIEHSSIFYIAMMSIRIRIDLGPNATDAERDAELEKQLEAEMPRFMSSVKALTEKYQKTA